MLCEESWNEVPLHSTTQLQQLRPDVPADSRAGCEAPNTPKDTRRQQHNTYY